MKLLAPALRELARMLGRLGHRLHLVLEGRKLARVETTLGLLGWQQAEYDPTTQRYADQLTDYEREQSRLTNESATLGISIQELEGQRTAQRREFEQEMAAALQKEQPGAANEAQLTQSAATKRKEHHDLEARLTALDRELASTEEQYRRRISQGAPEAELLQFRKVILALPRERAEWQARRDEVAGGLAGLETLLASLRSARGAFEKRDAALAGEIAARQRAKQKIEKQSDSLERAKIDPYREIGRALADNGVAPLNQPEALSAVLAQRQVISARESLLAASREASAAEDRVLLQSSWIALGVVLLSLGAVALVVASL